MSHGPMAVWREAAAETLWGRRGIVKAMHLFLPLAVVLGRSAPGELSGRWADGLLLFVAVALWSQLAILVNELTDRASDEAVGKRRWICSLPGPLGAALTLAYPLAGMLALVAMGASPATFGVYLFAVALACAYSLRPLRLKERGAWGIIGYCTCAAAGQAAAPCVALGADGPTLLLLTTATMLDKAVNLQFHQIVDYSGDRSAGVRTFATDAGLPSARRWLGAITWLAVLWLSATAISAADSVTGWRVAVGGVVGASFLAVSAYSIGQRRRRDEATDLVRQLPWAYLALTYVTFRVAPVVLLARLALLEPTLWAVAALACAMVLLESWQSIRYRLP